MKSTIEERTEKAVLGIVTGGVLGKLVFATPKERTETLVITGSDEVRFDGRDLYGVRTLMDYYSVYQHKSAKDTLERFISGYEKAPYGTEKDILYRLGQWLSSSKAESWVDTWKKAMELLEDGYSNVDDDSLDYLMIRCLGVALVAESEDELKSQCSGLADMVTCWKYMKQLTLFYAPVISVSEQL